MKIWLGDSNLVRFLAKNQHNKRKILYFENRHDPDPIKIRPHFHRVGIVSIFKIQHFPFSMLIFGKKKLLILDAANENFMTSMMLPDGH